MKKLSLAFLICLMSGCQEKTYPVGQIKTHMGEVLIWLYPETPRHKESFIRLANEGYWDSYTFNRVIPNFVAQGGCPDTPEGFADSPYLLKPEFSDSLTHVYGAVGGGRDNNAEMLTAGCQFYIVQNRNGEHRLDNKYTVFGFVFRGMDVVDAIVSVPRDSTDAPLEAIKLDVNILQMTKGEIEKSGFQIRD